MNSGRESSQPSFELPKEPNQEVDRANSEQAAEKPATPAERAGQQAKQPALPAIPDDIPVADQPVIAATPQDLTDPTSRPAAIPDSDHIQHEWVDKAKNVIAKTRDDPYLQKTEMSRVKADYIQKRFNKTVKTDEAKA